MKGFNRFLLIAPRFGGDSVALDRGKCRPQLCPDVPGLS
jgi:hypothetical protein